MYVPPEAFVPAQEALTLNPFEIKSMLYVPALEPSLELKLGNSGLIITLYVPRDES